MASARSLSDVPEERDSEIFSTAISPRTSSTSTQPYSMSSAATSSSSLHPDRINGRPSSNSHTARRTSSLRSIAATAADLQGSASSPSAGAANGSSGNTGTETSTQAQAQSSSGSQHRSSLRRASSTTSTINGQSSGSGHTSNPSVSGAGATSSATPRQSSSSSRHRDKDRNDTHIVKMRSTPRLVHDKEAEAAPSTGMYWSRAPVFGAIPNRTMRAHSVTLVDNVVWLFGGCDERESWRDVYCLDIETMQWSHPDCVGDIPPPSRAHSATLVDRKIVFIGGGHASTYYDSVYILDTTTRRWSRPVIAPGATPPQRRAHTAVLNGNKIWVFGGGNGMVALDDVWTLDVSGLLPYGTHGYGSGYGGGGYYQGGGYGSGLGRSGSGRNKDGSVTMKWELIETRGVKKPGPRGYHTANLVGNIMVVIGGSDGKDSFDELWTLNLDSREWTQIKANMSYKRLAHSSTQVGSYLFLYGGHDSTEYTSELVLLNLVSLQYETRTVYGKIPAPRGYHAAVLADSRLFLIGGFNGLTSFDDVQILELAASAYLPQVTSFAIEALVP
ncbi:hypothetical protein NP233_g5004 [Leucocoprinus birnbaumii]|uniref:Galactose oxidase n=1 Tax=Leucocoprinus birnbaumii TaxID=56174 RepID=A0AAD5W030_9AGAR|nr:hypothetical protein NP233_g5004 [Leucocoprinus birnbaumii]